MSNEQDTIEISDSQTVPPEINQSSAHGFIQGAAQLVGNIAGSAYNAAATVVGAAGNLAGHASGGVVHAAGGAAAIIIDTAEATAGNVVDAAGIVASGVKDTGKHTGHAVNSTGRTLLRATNTLRRRAGVVATTVSPVVSGQGADFGDLDPTKEPVILRIEISQSGEVKVLKWLSRILILFAIATLILLLLLKFDLNANLTVGDSYFLSSIIVCSILVALLLVTWLAFVNRMLIVRRNKLQWSHRRFYFSMSSFVILNLQIFNTVLTMVNAVYALARPCGWSELSISIIGYILWTLLNAEICVIVIMAHSGCIWRGKVADRTDSGDKTAAAESLSTDIDHDREYTIDQEVSIDKIEKGISLSQRKKKASKTDPPTALVLDAPLRIHLPKLVVPAFFQISITLMFLKILEGLPLIRHNAYGCTAGKIKKCVQGSSTRIYLSLVLVACAVYLAAYLYYSWKNRTDIRSKPYAEMRFARIVLGVQHQQVLPVFLTVVIGVMLTTSVQFQSCWTYVEAWMGILPLQAVGTAMSINLAVFFMPKRPKSSEQVLQSWLQEFSWTEKKLPEALESRNAKLIGSRTLSLEPMFCVETAIKLLYLSNIIYSIDSQEETEMKQEAAAAAAAKKKKKKRKIKLSGRKKTVKKDSEFSVEDASGEFIDVGEKINENNDVLDGEGEIDIDFDIENGEEEEEINKNENEEVEHTAEEDELDAQALGIGNIDVALSLYNLTHYEIIFEKETDTKTMLAWNDELLIVAFKGTSSFENIKTDLNLLQVNHPPTRFGTISSSWGLRLIPVLVQVHRGFYKAWVTNNYDQRILDRMDEIINSSPHPYAMKLMVTGHSLGGALATLAAHAIAKKFPGLSAPTVYTYGQPRVGNKAFAQEYNAMIPEHFAVINDQDPVTRVPIGWYKRVGNRVLINRLGDIIVRPGYLEMQLINTAAGEVSDHFLEAYRVSAMHIIKNQFTTRKLLVGQPGATELATALNLDTVLMGTNLDLEGLEDEDLVPLSVEDAYRKQLKERHKNSKRSLSLTCGSAGVAVCGCGKASDSSYHQHDPREEHVDHERYVKHDPKK